MPIRTSAVRSVLERLGLSDRSMHKGLRPAKRRALAFEPLEGRQLLSATVVHPPAIHVPLHPAPVSSVLHSAKGVKLSTSIKPQLAPNISTVASGLLLPSGVATDSAGDLFIADTYHNRILELNTSGVLSTVPVGGLLFPSAVAVDSAGDLFIADTWHNRVIEYNTSGVTTTVAGGLLLPAGVAVDSAGDVFIADTWHERVIEVSAGGVTSTVVGSGLLLPTGLAVDSSGDLFIADTYHSRVLEVTLATGATTTVASVNYPTGVAVDASGNLFIATTAFSNCVVEVSGGVVTTVAGSGSYGYGGDGGPATNAKLFLYWFPTFPSGIAVDSSDDLFIADTINNVVREVPAV